MPLLFCPTEATQLALANGVLGLAVEDMHVLQCRAQPDSLADLRRGASVGYKRIDVIETVQLDRLRLRVTQAVDQPVIQIRERPGFADHPVSPTVKLVQLLVDGIGDRVFTHPPGRQFAVFRLFRHRRDAVIGSEDQERPIEADSGVKELEELRQHRIGSHGDISDLR